LTGLQEIDSINEAIVVSYIEQVTPLPDEWLDDPTGYFTWDKYLTAYEDHGLGRIYYVEFDPEEATVAYVVNEFEDTGLVEYAEPNYFGYPCDTEPDDQYYPAQWYLKDYYPGGIRANKGWFYETGDPSIRIAIVDSGINMPHPDLSDKIIWPWDCRDLDDRPLDIDGHGSAVAGIAAAETNNDYDFYYPPNQALGVAGTSWGSLIVPLKIFENNDTEILYFNRAIDWAMTHHARVINMSFYIWDSGSAHDHCNAAWDAGHLLVAAAGNDNMEIWRYPAAWAVVIAVSAIDYEAVIVTSPPWDWGSSYGNHI
jgi:thermitase